MDHQSSWIDRLEESLIAILLGLMTLLTFANVVARYGFNSNILWALELTVFMFAWLVLLGASYAVKKSTHLGVDIIVNMLDPRGRRIMALVAVALCIIFTFLMLKGAWDYWANFANLPGTDGRWFPLGFEDKFRGKGWYEVESVFMPEILQWMAEVFNEGERYEKIPRLIPYAVVPVAMALMLFRFLQAAVRIWNGDIDRLVASHEVEDELAEMEAQQGRAS
ncbi:MAG: TRAP transporter small permease [Boseongicola sp.]